MKVEPKEDGDAKAAWEQHGKTFGEWRGWTPNEGIRCGCIPQAWFTLFVSIVRVVCLAPLALCSERYYSKWLGALVLLRLSWWGMEPWACNIALMFGMHELHSGKKLKEYQVPSNNIRRRHTRVRNPYLSDVLGSDFFMGEGDYDHWFPQCTRNLITWFLKRLNTFYYPQTLSPRNLKRCTNFAWHRMCAKSIERFGSIYAERVSLGEGEEKHSEMAAIRYCIQGYGAYFLEKRGDGYVVDMSFAESLPVKKGYHVMGGCMRLPASLDSIEGLELQGKTYRPGDTEWKGAFYVFRCTCTSVQIVYPHVIECHYARGGFTATVVREMDPDHPWCRALAPFTVATLNANFGARSMISGTGAILDRIGGWSLWSIQELHRRGFRELRVERFPDNLQRRGVLDLPKDKYPYGHLGKKLFSIFERFAQDYVDLYWSTDLRVAADSGLQEFFSQYRQFFPEICENPPQGAVSTRAELVTFLSSHIWSVTAVHEHSGHIGDLVKHFDMFHSHVVDGDLADLESLLPSVCSRLSVYFSRALTSRPGAKLYQPDPTALTRFFLEDFDVGIARRFMFHLRVLHEEMTETNEEHCADQSWQFKSFDPFELEISVTV